MSTPPKRVPVKKTTGSAGHRARRAGPTDIHDPAVREEAKKALIWLGIAGLMGLTVMLAQPLMVVFGGMVFGALLDGGARLLGRVLPIGRVWRVVIVLLLAVAFSIWFLGYAGSQITEQAAALLTEWGAGAIGAKYLGHSVRDVPARVAKGGRKAA